MKKKYKYNIHIPCDDLDAKFLNWMCFRHEKLFATHTLYTDVSIVKTLPVVYKDEIGFAYVITHHRIMMKKKMKIMKIVEEKRKSQDMLDTF